MKKITKKCYPARKLKHEVQAKSEFALGASARNEIPFEESGIVNDLHKKKENVKKRLDHEVFLQTEREKWERGR